ncbi:hypothetical protein K0504_16315 [Neiella marina]|uniref:Uncharacterized protein n=1 Tax=Neiella holothuriorum TaxID=2870530 RepID=A0ABS7EJT9_9GAMM|nr:hypothetical protein [Neiella holothuriorum]MBW8192604.1 hypothetical protein [Neiella holothuriorum]
MSLLVSLWLFWLLLWLVFTIILIKQSRDLLKQLAFKDESFEFRGWRRLLTSVWRQEHLAYADPTLQQVCEDYRKLLNIWIFMAGLVVLVRLIILVTHG